MGNLSVLSVLSLLHSSHSAVGSVLRTTSSGNRELHPRLKWGHDSGSAVSSGSFCFVFRSSSEKCVER